MKQFKVSLKVFKKPFWRIYENIRKKLIKPPENYRSYGDIKYDGGH